MSLALITGLKENTAAAPPLPLSKSQKKKLRKKNNGQAVNIEGGGHPKNHYCQAGGEEKYGGLLNEWKN